MFNKNTQYRERNFLIDDSDKELFIMMKSIVDSGFPPALEPMLISLYKKCWEKKKKIAYREIGQNTIFITFPPINPIMRFFGGILLRFTRGWVPVIIVIDVNINQMKLIHQNVYASVIQYLMKKLGIYQNELSTL